jgi:hypothetical protein
MEPHKGAKIIIKKVLKQKGSKIIITGKDTKKKEKNTSL